MAHLKTKKESLEKVLSGLTTRIKKTRSQREIYELVVDSFSALSHFNWTGIYLVDGEELKLEYYKGKPTDHVRIPKGRGVCGSAWLEGRNIIVNDVRNIENYLACSLETRSEIVVLLRKDGQIIGQIDVDSDQVAAFSSEDELALQQAATLVAERIKELDLA
ncbi:MAG: GAF domain-containing protein [Candidatus Heimdallarchaeota archaeon]